MMKMVKRILSFVVMAAMLMEMAMAANYTVGAPNGGWDQSTDLQTWADSISFLEGDSLIFQFTTNHDVTEVSKSDFDSCSASNPQQPPLTSGSAVVPLTTAGSRYFICGTGGHCITGMKVAITVAAAAASSPPPATTPAVPSPPPSTTPEAPAPPPKTAAPAPPPSTTPAAPAPPPKTAAPAPPPKQSKAASPPPSVPALNAPPTASSIPPPPPSSAAKFEVMGGLFGLVLMIFLIN